MKNKLKEKLKALLVVTGFTIILSLFISVAVFAVIAAAEYVGLYNNRLALGALISLAVGVFLIAGVTHTS